MSAAWMNIVYGFGGMRSDGEILTFKPKMPEKWKKYSFTIIVRGSILKVEVSDKKAVFTVLEGENVEISIYDKKYEITKGSVSVEY